MHLTRRTCLRLGALGALGLAFPGRARAAEPRAKRCILLWMHGGPSHIDTFDPKAGGPFKAIASAAAGLQVCEHLPLVAAEAKHLSVIRSLTSPEGDHARASYFLHTGSRPQPTVSHPALGAVVSLEKGAWKEAMPPWVTLASPFAESGFLGPAHAPLALYGAEQGSEDLILPAEESGARLVRRRRLLSALDAVLAGRVQPADVEAAQAAREGALSLLTGPAARAFDLTLEPEAVRDRYGDSEFGRGCLVARRLVEHGTRFVEVGLDGWDTHEDNARQLKEDLLPVLDRSMSALIADLAERGLLQDTLVVWMGEFGRTPEINEAGGRDHHAEAFSAVLAGAGVPGGTVIGASDAEGRKPVERPVSVQDLLSTVVLKLGIDPATTYSTPEGRPITLIQGGKPIPELGPV